MTHEKGKGILRIAGASFYQVFCDGKLLHFGPARKAHGFAAVDTLFLPENTKELTICGMGYLVNTEELSEVTQYYALRFGTADLLPGIYLRIELLLKWRMP